MLLLCTLSLLVSLVVANSNAHQKQPEAVVSPVKRIGNNVPQEIRNRVPVDFAALNLRKSRMKHQPDKNTLRHRPEIEKRPKALNNQPKRINAMKNSYKLSKYGKHEGQVRKKLTNKSVGLKKAPQLRMDSLPDKYTSTERAIVSTTEIIIKGIKTSTVQPTISYGSMKNSFANINRAINALPQQMVTVLRDDIDCNDNPMRNLENMRGPPCIFSRRWPGTGEHSSFWMKNPFPQNWDAFTE